MEKLSVAIVQSAPKVGDIDANIAEATRIVRGFGGRNADFYLFPELSLTGYDMAVLERPDAWLQPADARLAPMRAACLETRTTAVVSAPFLTDDGRRWIGVLTLSPGANDIVQGKRHLHDGERDLFDADTRPLRCIDVNGWRIALAICYDAAVPRHAIEAAALDADVYAVPCLYTAEQARRLDIHMAARAMDHRMYSLAANLASSGDGSLSCGGSGVWLPDGTRGRHMGTGPGTLTLDLCR